MTEDVLEGKEQVTNQQEDGGLNHIYSAKSVHIIAQLIRQGNNNARDKQKLFAEFCFVLGQVSAAEVFGGNTSTLEQSFAGWMHAVRYADPRYLDELCNDMSKQMLDYFARLEEVSRNALNKTEKAEEKAPESNLIQVEKPGLILP